MTKKKYTEESLKKFLQVEGWRFANPVNFASWSAYKRVTGWPRCRCNKKSPPVILTYDEISTEAKKYEVCKVEVIGECRGKKWVNVKFYSLGIKEVMTGLDDIVELLGRAWKELSK